jgi:hypothetical protein
LVDESSLVLAVIGLTFEVVPLCAGRVKNVGSRRESSRGLGSAPEYYPGETARSTTVVPPLIWLTLLGFGSPSAHGGHGKRLDRACLTRLCSVFRLLPPPDALLLPKPARLSFTPVALVGFSLQRFPLRNGRGRLSASLSLLAFPTVGSLESAVRRGPPLREKRVGGLQGFELVRSPFVRSVTVRSPTGADSSPGFQLSRVFPLPATA